MDEKIIQITPIAGRLEASWVSDGKEKHIIAVCLALVEDKDGARSVRPMAVYNGNEIQIIPDTVSLRYTM